MSWLAAAVLAMQLGFPLPTDTRLQTIDYRPGQVVNLQTAPGYQLTVTLSSDEQVQTVAVGDSAAWQVTASKSGSQLFIKAVGSGSTTNMTVVTSNRQYVFLLQASPEPPPGMPLAVTFRYPTQAGAAAEPTKVAGNYFVRGAKSLWPSVISDDGTHTFIEWPRDIDLPATYAIDRHGRESLVSGMFRGDRLVIDAVWPELVFRLDGKVAHARRESAQDGR